MISRAKFLRWVATRSRGEGNVFTLRAGGAAGHLSSISPGERALSITLSHGFVDDSHVKERENGPAERGDAANFSFLNVVHHTLAGSLFSPF